jgi:hypothetical protein
MEQLNNVIEQKIAYELGSLRLQIMVLEAEKLQLMSENSRQKVEIDGLKSASGVQEG